MMKYTCIEFFLTGVQHPFMKRNIDSDWGFDPVGLFILPVIFFIRAIAARPA